MPSSRRISVRPGSADRVGSFAAPVPRQAKKKIGAVPSGVSVRVGWPEPVQFAPSRLAGKECSFDSERTPNFLVLRPVNPCWRSQDQFFVEIQIADQPVVRYGTRGAPDRPLKAGAVSGNSELGQRSSSASSGLRGGPAACARLKQRVPGPPFGPTMRTFEAVLQNRPPARQDPAEIRSRGPFMLGASNVRSCQEFEGNRGFLPWERCCPTKSGLDRGACGPMNLFLGASGPVETYARRHQNVPPRPALLPSPAGDRGPPSAAGSKQIVKLNLPQPPSMPPGLSNVCDGFQRGVGHFGCS